MSRTNTTPNAAREAGQATSLRIKIEEMIAESIKSGTGYFRISNGERAIAVCAPGHRNWGVLTATSKPVKGDRPATHILYLEWRSGAGYGDDEMSVTGTLLEARAGSIINNRTVWVIADEMGQPDIDYLCRDGGGLAKVVARAGGAFGAI